MGQPNLVRSQDRVFLEACGVHLDPWVTDEVPKIVHHLMTSNSLWDRALRHHGKEILDLIRLLPLAKQNEILAVRKGEI